MKLSKVLVLLLAAGALAGIVAGVGGVLRSPYFRVQSVEVRDLARDAPVSPEALVRLANVPIDRVNLFRVDLKDVSRRIQAHPWVKEARVSKRLPNVLELNVEFRKPVALLLTPAGVLQYVDKQGVVFSELTLKFDHDLPLIDGVMPQETDKILTAVSWMDRWRAVVGGVDARMSTFQWTPGGHVRVTLSYPLGRTGERSRAIVELGMLNPTEVMEQMDRVSKVINHLSRNSIRVRQISADSDKKVVVSLSQGS